MAKSADNDLSLLPQLGKRIAYLRKKRGMSQLDLSLEANVSKSYISDLENGRRNPSALLLQRIAFALGVSLEKLFQGVVPLDALLR